jgi:hypothetical protein
VSSVEAGVGIGRASARAAVSAPPWMWIAVAVGVAALTWSCCKAQADEVPDWLDPNQPPISVPTDYSTTLLGQLATAPGQQTGGCRRPKKYPWGSLMASPECWVGDC